LKLLDFLKQGNVQGAPKQNRELFFKKILTPSLTNFLLIFSDISVAVTIFHFNKLTDNHLFKVLSTDFNASIQSSWKVVNNAAKVLYFILAHSVAFMAVFESKLVDFLGSFEMF
jgi:hypothetical protein